MLRVTMTTVKRKRLLSIATFGTLLTLLVLAADWGRRLDPLERYFYDLRVRRCQHYARPATDKLVHIDVDDEALNQFGRWPWARGRFASIIDELHYAGAKAIFLDVLFSETSGNTPEEIAQDELLEKAIRRAGNVILAISPRMRSPAETDPIQAAMKHELQRDLELTAAELQASLAPRAAELPGVESRVIVEFLAVRASAMTSRILETLETGTVTPEDVAHQLLPKATTSSRGLTGTIARQFDESYRLATAEFVVHKFTLAPSRNAPLLVIADPEGGQLPLWRFSDAANHAACVTYLRESDGVVRSIPLAATYNGRPLLQVGLVAACIALDVDVPRVKLGSDEIIIPRPQGDIHIPTRAYPAGRFTGTQMFFDIPLFGSRTLNSWERMYDVPAHQQPKARMNVTQVIAAIETRENVARIVRTAAARILDVLDPEGSKEFQSAAPTMQWPQLVKEVADINDRLQLSIDSLAKLSDATTDEKHLLQRLSALGNEQAALEKLAILETTQPILAKLRDEVSGRVVFLGSVSTSVPDLVATSIDPTCPGVYLHGATFNAIMTGEFWKTAPRWIDYTLTAAMGLLMTIAVAAFSPPRAFLALLLLNGSYAAVNGYWLFDKHNLIVGAAGPVVAAAVVWAGVTLIQFIREIGERARLTRRFSSYVDPTLVNYVIENPDKARLEGHQQEMTVVFTDLQGFTTLAEKLGPRAAQMLGQYMEVMVPLIRAKRGYVNKFLGDGIMFFFGAPVENPNHAADAVCAVLDMQKAIDPFNEKLKAQGLPTVSMRAGVSTGQMVVGDAGPSFASDYTVLGDAVNLAARLEGANKPFGTANMITERTVELLKGQFITRPIARLLVVGKVESATVHEAIAPAVSATENEKRLAKLSADMFGAFAAQRFDDCERILNQMDEEFGESKFTHRYAEEIKSRRGKPFDPNFKGEIQLFAK
jgi:class 3 adenylate cyclase/CHASE2 domain-containing sensor protein